MIWIDRKYLGEQLGGYPPAREILPPEHVPELEGYFLQVAEEDILHSRDTISIRPSVWDRYQNDMVFQFRERGGSGTRSYTEDQLRELYEQEKGVER